MKHHCKVREALAAEFATAARLYAERVVEWVRAASREDHVRFRNVAEDAQLRAIKAGLCYEAHVEAHDCCDGPTNVLNIASRRHG